MVREEVSVEIGVEVLLHEVLDGEEVVHGVEATPGDYAVVLGAFAKEPPKVGLEGYFGELSRGEVVGGIGLPLPVLLRRGRRWCCRRG